jgi:hypothetical protein
MILVRAAVWNVSVPLGAAPALRRGSAASGRWLCCRRRLAVSAVVAAGAGMASRTAGTITCGDTTYALTVTSIDNDPSSR